MSEKLELPTNATELCKSILDKMPRRYNKRQVFWKDDVESTAKIAAALLGCADVRSAIFHLYTETGVGAQTFGHFIYGNDSSGVAWPDLRAAIKRLGVEHMVTRVEARKQRVMGGNPLKMVAPVAGPPPVKPITIAVTNKGEVITATPTPAATTPTAMVAQGGDFAVKTYTTRCAIDANTGDILVITTRRILYGSPDHRTKMIEMNSKKA